MLERRNRHLQLLNGNGHLNTNLPTRDPGGLVAIRDHGGNTVESQALQAGGLHCCDDLWLFTNEVEFHLKHGLDSLLPAIA
jgi:hypothetical protein